MRRSSGIKRQFGFGKIDAGIWPRLRAGQVLTDQVHAGPCSAQHGVHVATLDIELDVAAATEAVEDAPLTGEGHRVRKSAENFAV